MKEPKKVVHLFPVEQMMLGIIIGTLFDSRLRRVGVELRSSKS